MVSQRIPTVVLLCAVLGLLGMYTWERSENTALRNENAAAYRRLSAASAPASSDTVDAPVKTTFTATQPYVSKHPGWNDYDSKGLFETIATEDMYSSSHCIGNSEKHKTDPNLWKKTSCRFKNLCYDPKANRFRYYKQESDPFKAFVAIGPVNEQWTDADKFLVRWQPEIINGPLPKGTEFRTHQDNEVYVPHFEHCAANVMHLIMDSFYPWHNLVELFNIQKHIVPLRVRVLKPLWGTCDFVLQEKNKGEAWAQHHYGFCPRNVQRWLPAMLPKVNGKALTDITNVTTFGQDNPSQLVCFKDAVVGEGLVSDHCLKAHGWAWDKKDIADADCNQNRGRMLWSFRNRMIHVSGARQLLPKKHKVLLFHFGSRGGPRWSIVRKHLKEIFSDGSVVIEDAVIGDAAKQIEQVQTATVLIASMGGNTVTSLFLPRGAGLLLMHDGKDRLDWDVWTHAPHIALEWFKQTEMVMKSALETYVRRRMKGYDDFGDGFDSTEAPAAPSTNTPEMKQETEVKAEPSPQVEMVAEVPKEEKEKEREKEPEKEKESATATENAPKEMSPPADAKPEHPEEKKPEASPADGPMMS